MQENDFRQHLVLSKFIKFLQNEHSSIDNDEATIVDVDMVNEKQETGSDACVCLFFLFFFCSFVAMLHSFVRVGLFWLYLILESHEVFVNIGSTLTKYF